MPLVRARDRGGIAGGRRGPAALPEPETDPNTTAGTVADARRTGSKEGSSSTSERNFAQVWSSWGMDDLVLILRLCWCAERATLVGDPSLGAGRWLFRGEAGPLPAVDGRRGLPCEAPEC